MREHKMSNAIVNVLVVEDIPIAQIAARFVLEQISGIKIDIANNGAHALTLATQTQYDLIFMDIGLPDIDGFEVTKKLRSMANYTHTPIIALTAHDEDSYKKRAAEVGMNDFLEKPLTEEKSKAIFDHFILNSIT